MNSLFRLIVAILFSSLLAACGSGSGSDSDNPNASPPSHITDQSPSTSPLDDLDVIDAIPEPATEPEIAIPFSVDATLTWDAPVQRENGEPLGSEDITQYEVTYSDPQGELHTQTILGSKTQLSITMLEGSYEFAISATDNYGLSSALSNPIHCDISPSSSICI